MVDTYPPEVSTFQVVWKAARGAGDSSDSGQLPDLYPLAGVKVTFTPALSPPVFKVATATPQALTIYQESVFAITNELGILTMIDDPSTGVFLAWGFDPDINPTGWTWNVLVEPPGNFPSSTFSIDGGPTGTVIDLTTVVPVPANPGTEIPLWQAARDTIVAARDTVISLAATVAAQYTELAAWLSASVTPVYSSSLSGTRTFLTTEVVNVYRKYTLSGNVTFGTLPTPSAPWNSRAFSLTIALTQSGVTPYTVTFPANVKWPDDVMPLMTTGLSRTMYVVFEWDGDRWLGYLGDEFSA